MDELRSRLLLSAADDLLRDVLPELTSSHSRRIADVTVTLLRYLAIEGEEGPELRRRSAPALLSTTGALIDSLDRTPGGPEAIGDLRLEHEALAAWPDDGSAERIAALRTLLARLFRQAAVIGAASPSGPLADQLDESAKVEAEWARGVRGFQLQVGRLPAPTGAPTGAMTVLSPEAMTTYLRERRPETPAIRCTEIVAPTIGYSKATVFVTLENGGDIPDEVVLRRDAVVDYFGIGTSVVDEQPVLRHLADLGLPVPDPVYLEPEETELGPPFVMTALMPGVIAGLRSVWHPGMAHREVAEDVARFLAVLHQADVSGLNLRPPVASGGGDDTFLEKIKAYRATWERMTVEPSPITEYAFAWLEREARAGGLRGTSLVHGDVGPHNMLIDQGRLSGLADWELMHIGDAAEDLGYFRPAAEAVMPWAEFLQTYYDAGGDPIDERRMQILSVMTAVRNNGFVAACSRRFKDEGRPLPVGAIGFNALRVNEVLIADALGLD